MWPRYCMFLFFRGFQWQVSDYFSLFEQSTLIPLLVSMWVVSSGMQGSSSISHVGYLPIAVCRSQWNLNPGMNFIIQNSSHVLSFLSVQLLEVCTLGLAWVVGFQGHCCALIFKLQDKHALSLKKLQWEVSASTLQTKVNLCIHYHQSPIFDINANTFFFCQVEVMGSPICELFADVGRENFSFIWLFIVT